MKPEARLAEIIGRGRGAARGARFIFLYLPSSGTLACGIPNR